MTVDRKKCGGCGQLLPLTAFRKVSQNNDGYQGRCKECVKAGPFRLPHLEGTKKCRSCLVELPYSSFRRSKDMQDGYRASCKRCLISGAASHRVRTEDSRRCADCHIFKPLSEFHRLTKYPNRCRPYCKPCSRERTRISQKKNRDHRKEYAKERNKLPEVREKIRERERLRRAEIKADPIRYSEYLSKVKEKNRRRYEKHPEKFIAANALYRARKLSAEGAFSEQDIAELYKKQSGKCLYCDSRVGRRAGIKAAVDHFIPLARGGTNDPQNLVLSCFSCNSRKGAKLPWEWMPERFSRSA